MADCRRELVCISSRCDELAEDVERWRRYEWRWVAAERKPDEREVCGSHLDMNVWMAEMESAIGVDGDGGSGLIRMDALERRSATDFVLPVPVSVAVDILKCYPKQRRWLNQFVLYKKKVKA